MTIKNRLSKIINEEIDAITAVSGGDIGSAYKITTKNNNQYFAKTSDFKDSTAMLKMEYEGLKHLQEKAQVNIPQIIKVGKSADSAFLVLEWIEQGKKNDNTSQTIADQLVKLHSTEEKYFGLDYDNFIGYLEQINSRDSDWLSFYYKNRIEYQLKLAIDSGRLDSSLIKKIDKMFRLIEQEHPKVKPCLLHGDLWNGNIIFGQGGMPYFIDPAIYYGYREMDYAMMKLFGGFNEDIFDAINDKMPIDKGYKDRLKFYQLYYILVHVNIFGGSYAYTAREIIQYYGC